MEYGKDFTLAVRTMWGLLVTSPSTILTQALIDKLFNVSYGFIGRASSMLRKTQEYLIVLGEDETITPEAIDFVSDRYLANSGEYVSVMKSVKLAVPEGMSMRDLPEEPNNRPKRNKNTAPKAYSEKKRGRPRVDAADAESIRVMARIAKRDGIPLVDAISKYIVIQL